MLKSAEEEQVQRVTQKKRDELARLEYQCLNLVQQKDNLSVSIIENEQVLSKLQGQIENKRNSLENLDNDISELETNKSNLSLEEKNLKNDLEKVQKSIESIETKKKEEPTPFTPTMQKKLFRTRIFRRKN